MTERLITEIHRRAVCCDLCGQYLAYADIVSGAATHEMVYPDSDLTSETWETTCEKCLKKETEVTLEDLFHINLTGGVDSVEHIRRVRAGE